MRIVTMKSDESYVSVDFTGGQPNSSGGYDNVYSYSIVKDTGEHTWRYDGTVAVGGDINEWSAMSDVLDKLMDVKDILSQEFPIHVREWACVNYDELEQSAYLLGRHLPVSSDASQPPF